MYFQKCYWKDRIHLVCSNIRKSVGIVNKISSLLLRKCLLTLTTVFFTRIMSGLQPMPPTLLRDVQH